MPVDFIQIKTQIKQMGSEAPERYARLSLTRQNALDIFKQYAHDSVTLQQLVWKTAEKEKGLRCAIPYEKELAASHPLPQSTEGIVILGTDGSQVNPDRHASIEFGVINVGAFRIEPGSKNTPREFVRSQLLYHDDLYTPDGPISEEIVALRRDLNERKFLVELVQQEKKPTIGLTDGPLELFRAPSERKLYDRYLDDYIFQLKNLARLKTIVAGYVDRPRSDLVVRMLELCVSAEYDSKKSKQPRIFTGLRDYDLFIDKIKPGERSAIFGIVSSSTENFTDELALHFFYINIGSLDHPYLARVEMPTWVVDDKEKVDLLHGCLIKQCQQMGDKAYPYVLHRAHEVAVLSHDEKNHLQGLIIAEMLARGIDIKGSSHKQFAKDNSGKRTRYK